MPANKVTGTAKVLTPLPSSTLVTACSALFADVYKAIAMYIFDTGENRRLCGTKKAALARFMRSLMLPVVVFPVPRVLKPSPPKWTLGGDVAWVAGRRKGHGVLKIASPVPHQIGTVRVPVAMGVGACEQPSATPLQMFTLLGVLQNFNAVEHAIACPFDSINPLKIAPALKDLPVSARSLS